MISTILLVSAIGVARDPAPFLVDPSGDWTYTYDGAGSDSFASGLSKWDRNLGDWKGTPPGAFHDENAQANFGLELFARQEIGFSPEGIAEQCECGFEDITTPLLVSKTAFKFGFFEISAQFAASSIQTSFWLQGFVGEINVVDAVAASNEEEGKSSLKSDYHCFDPETDGQNTESDSKSLMDFLPDAFDPTAQHTYGIDWSADAIIYYVDGVPVRTLKASAVQTQGCLNDEMNVILSMETIEAHGIPTESELKSTVSYFRHWTRSEATTATPAPTTSTSTSTSTIETKLPCTGQFRGPVPGAYGARTRFLKINSWSVEDCAYKCEFSHHFTSTFSSCASFSYRAGTQFCWLFSMNGIEMGTDIKPNANWDHYYSDPTCPTSGVTTVTTEPTTAPERPCTAQYRGPVVGTRSTSKQHKMGMVMADSIAECAWQCDAKVDAKGAVCKEFSYFRSKKKCFMFKEGANQKADSRFDHYYADETCPTGSITTIQPTTKGIHEEAVEGSVCAEPTWTLATIANDLKHKICSSPFVKVDQSSGLTGKESYNKCDSAKPFKTATTRCAQKGGRICTMVELKRKVGKQTPDKCGINNKLVWTTDECPAGHMVVKANSGKKGVCKADTAKAKTMCCGDNVAPGYFEVGALANGGAERDGSYDGDDEGYYEYGYGHDDDGYGYDDDANDEEPGGGAESSDASSAAGAQGQGEVTEAGTGTKGGVVTAGVLVAVLVMLSVGIVLRSRYRNQRDVPQHKPNSDDMDAAAGAGGNEPTTVSATDGALPVDSDPRLQEDVGGSTESSFAFVTALDKERQKSIGSASAPTTPERRASFAEAAEAEATFLRSGMGPAVGKDELTRLHALSTANVRGAVQMRTKKAAIPSIAEESATPPPPPSGDGEAFDAAVLQLNEHGNGLRVQSTYRGNPLYRTSKAESVYRGSVYEESDKIGISEL